VKLTFSGSVPLAGAPEKLAAGDAGVGCDAASPGSVFAMISWRFVKPSLSESCDSMDFIPVEDAPELKTATP
jgi:hypothetical protein